jgi:hypothetical protein
MIERPFRDPDGTRVAWHLFFGGKGYIMGSKPVRAVFGLILIGGATISIGCQQDKNLTDGPPGMIGQNSSKPNVWNRNTSSTVADGQPMNSSNPSIYSNSPSSTSSLASGGTGSMSAASPAGMTNGSYATGTNAPVVTNTTQGGWNTGARTMNTAVPVVNTPAPVATNPAMTGAATTSGNVTPVSFQAPAPQGAAPTGSSATQITGGYVTPGTAPAASGNPLAKSGTEPGTTPFPGGNPAGFHQPAFSQTPVMTGGSTSPGATSPATTSPGTTMTISASSTPEAAAHTPAPAVDGVPPDGAGRVYSVPGSNAPAPTTGSAPY